MEAVGGLLWLPDGDAPALQVHQRADGVWQLETGAETRVVHNEEVLQVGGRAFRLVLPEGGDTTLRAGELRPTLSTVHFHFRVSRDEEHCELHVKHPSGLIDLGARAHLYSLLTLARLRQADAELEPSLRGWVDQERLLRMLAVEVSKLNLDVFRGRRQLAKAGVDGATGVVERRTGARQLRFGSDAVSVEQI